MTCPNETLSLSDLVVSFTARYTLNGQMTGSVQIANPDCDFVSDCDVCQPVSLDIDSSTVINCGCESVDPDCFEVSPIWLHGVVNSYQESGFFEDVPCLSGSVVSYADYLDSKPINTQMFPYEDLNVVLGELATTYLGLPLSLIDFRPVPGSKVSGPIQGNSSLAELALLAEAGCSHLFTQVGGVLTIEPWKGLDDPVEVVIPSDLICYSEKAPVNPGRVSVVRARGVGVSKTDCGMQIFSDTRTDTALSLIHI